MQRWSVSGPFSPDMVPDVGYNSATDLSVFVQKLGSLWWCSNKLGSI